MYTKGEVIWAKIKGFPWWPGVIAKVIEDKSNPHSSVEILVNFIGENSHAQLSLDKVAKYQDKYNDFAKMKKKKLLESIEIANKILKGETTFEFESDKLKAEYESVMAEHKPKPKPTNAQNPKKAKNTKSDEKSSTHEYDSVMGQYESDQSSTHEAETVAEFERIQKKLKPNEKKESTRQNSSITSNSSEPEKTPATSQNTRVLPRKGNPTEELRGMRDLKSVKVSNMEELIESEGKDDAKKLEELNGKLLRQNSKQSVASNTTHANSSNTVTNDPIKNNILTPSSLQNGATNGAAELHLKRKELEELLEFVIEKIANFGLPSVTGPIIEARIEDVLLKINPEPLSLSEIIENDLGKNTYSLLILLDELATSVPNSGTSIEFDVIKDKLINYIDIIKNKLVFEHVEKYEHFSTWLNKLNEKKEIEAQKRKDDHKLGKNNGRMEEEIEAGKNDEELKENTSMINFEDYRFGDAAKKVLNEKNKMVTTSTVSKTYHSTLEAAKLTDKQKEVPNPNLRKKICVKMCKILQEKYHVEKEKAQLLTMKIEANLRVLCPDMQTGYKDNVLILLKSLKYSLFNLQEATTSDFQVDYKALKEKVEEYQKQHGNALDGGFGYESPR